MPKAEKAERFTEITAEGKQGWNVVTGCCHCKFRRSDAELFPDDYHDNLLQGKPMYPGPDGSCKLVHPPWPKKPPQCARSICPTKLRLLIDANKRQPFRVYADPDKPTRWWKLRMWLKRLLGRS